MARCQNLSLDMIYALEDLWMRNPKASVDDIGKSEVDKVLSVSDIINYKLGYHLPDRLSRVFFVIMAEPSASVTPL